LEKQPCPLKTISSRLALPNKEETDLKIISLSLSLSISLSLSLSLSLKFCRQLFFEIPTPQKLENH
jgi:hypothetical protein